MAKLKTPKELAPLVHEYLKEHGIGFHASKRARNMAIRFHSNVNNVKAACSLLRTQGVLIGGGRHGYYIVSTPEEYKIAMKLYYQRYIVSLQTFKQMINNGKAEFGVDVVVEVVNESQGLSL